MQVRQGVSAQGLDKGGGQAALGLLLHSRPVVHPLWAAKFGLCCGLKWWHLSL